MLRPSLILSSLANIAAGLGLATLWYQYRHDEGMPLIVLFVALALLVQGAFTLGHVEGLWKRWRIPSFQLFVTGEAGAALIGGVAILPGVLYNLRPKIGRASCRERVERSVAVG